MKAGAYWNASVLCLLAVCVAVTFSVRAQSHGDESVGEHRPKIGLVLSGGGARGAAHVGVLKVLEQLRIPIDCIAGTSMGAIVGGLYASGMSTDELEKTLGNIDWDSVFNDAPPRPNRTQRRKSDDRLYLVKGAAGVKDGKINFPTAVVQGQQFGVLLRSLTLPVASIRNFDHLSIPFRAVATDIATGDAVVLRSGDLAQAIRASMAVPAIFAPVEIGGKLLVDGGISNNLPISVVRDMGADVVIAVDISTPLLSREQLGSLISAAYQLTGFLTRKNTELQLASLGDRDILIVPDLGDIATGDFSRVLEAIPPGLAAARAKAKDLRQLSMAKTQFAAYRRQHRRPGWKPPVIDFVQFNNQSRVSNEMLAAQFGLHEGDPLDLKQVEAGIARVYSLAVFESVRYDVVEQDGKTGLVVEAKQRSWGTDSLQFGMQLSADLDTDSYFNIGAAYTKRPLDGLNGEWRTAIQVGDEPLLSTEIYQPLDPASRYFVDANLTVSAPNLRLFSADRADVQYKIHRTEITVAGGRNFGTWGELRVAMRRSTGDADVTVGGPGQQGFDFDDGQIFIRGTLDTLDNVHFPRAGQFGVLEWDASRRGLGADTNFDQARLRYSGARSWGGHTLLGTFSFDTTLDGEAPIQDRFRLGGFLRLSGFQQNQLSGQHAGFAGLGYMYRLHGGRLFPTYVGGAAQFGNVWEDTADIRPENLLATGAAFIGVDTPIGPVYAGYGRAEGGHAAVYLFLGQPWF